MCSSDLEYKYEDEGAQLTVLVEGTPEDWAMTTSAGVPGEEPMISVVTTKEEQDSDTTLAPDYVTEVPSGQSGDGASTGEVSVSKFSADLSASE